MSKSKELLLNAKQKSGQAIVAGTALVLSSQVFALDDASNTAVTAALDSGETSVGLVVAGLIGIAAVVAGFSLVYSLLKR